MFRYFLIIAFFLTTDSLAQSKYLQYDTDLIKPASYGARRKAFMDSIGKGSAALLFAAPERVRNADVNYQYRQNDNFYYLTGFNEPNAVLLLAPGGITVPDTHHAPRTRVVHEILYVQKNNLLQERWTGRLYGPENAVSLAGFEYSLTNDKFKFDSLLAVVRSLHFGVDPKYYNIGVKIEDVILVTAGSNENLSAAAPREIRDIENLMKKKGSGNVALSSQ